MSIFYLDINIIELIANKLNVKEKIIFNCALNKSQKIKYNKDTINKLRIINFINENNVTIHNNCLSSNFIKFLNINYLEPDVINFSILYNFKLNPFIGTIYEKFITDMKNNRISNNTSNYPDFNEIINNNDNQKQEFINDIYKYITPKNFKFLYNNSKYKHFIIHIFSVYNIIFRLFNSWNKDMLEFFLINYKNYGFENVLEHFYKCINIIIDFKHTRTILIDLYELFILNETHIKQILDKCIVDLDSDNYFKFLDKISNN